MVWSSIFWFENLICTSGLKIVNLLHVSKISLQNSVIQIRYSKLYNPTEDLCENCTFLVDVLGKIVLFSRFVVDNGVF